MEKTGKLFVGIDIGEHSLKAVKLEKGPEGGVRILDYAIREGLHSGSNIDSTVIRDLVNKLKAEGAEVCAVASGQDIVVKHAVVPFMPKEELRDAVRWSLKEVTNFNLDESVLDFQIIGTITGTDGIKRNEVLAVAMPSALLNKQVKVLQDAFLEPTLITVAHFALANFIAHNERLVQGKTSAVIDIGLKKATILIFKGAQLQFIRQISSAGESFTKALSGVVVTFPQRIELDIAKAEDIKRKCGIPSKSELSASQDNIPLTQISVLMRPVLERLLTDIRGSFKYFREEFQVETVDQIFLVGGGARLKNLVEFVKEGLGGIPTEFLPLPHNFTSEVADDKGFQEALPAFIASIGACVGPDTAINLVPRSIKIQKSISIQQRILQLFGMLLLILVPFTFATLLANENRYKKILVSYNGYYSNLVKLRTLRDNIIKRQQFFNEIIGQEPSLFLYLKELSRLVPKSIEFNHLGFDRGEMVFSIQGFVYTADISAEKILATFLLDLENSRYFSDVNLISSRKVTENLLEALAFDVDVKLVKIK